MVECSGTVECWLNHEIRHLLIILLVTILTLKQIFGCHTAAHGEVCRMVHAWLKQEQRSEALAVLQGARMFTRPTTVHVESVF